MLTRRNFCTAIAGLFAFGRVKATENHIVHGQMVAIELTVCEWTPGWEIFG